MIMLSIGVPVLGPNFSVLFKKRSSEAAGNLMDYQGVMGIINPN